MFAQRLKQLRTERQISQSELASALNISNRTISMYEQGNSEPNVDTLSKIADFFNVTTDYLIGRTEGRTIDLQALYEEIGLSESSLSFLRSLTEFQNTYPPNISYVSEMSPLPCIDFCLSQGQLSFEFFDSIYSYFIANISDNNKIYISKSGDVSLNAFADNVDFQVYQTIPSSYLRDAILQEVSAKLKDLRKLYIDSRPEF